MVSCSETPAFRPVADAFCRLLGMGFLLFAAVVTNYTAKLLARCLMKAPSQAFVSYSDIAYIAYGARARMFVSLLFTFELLGACTALVRSTQHIFTEDTG